MGGRPGLRSTAGSRWSRCRQRQLARIDVSSSTAAAAAQQQQRRVVETTGARDCILICRWLGLHWGHGSWIAARCVIRRRRQSQRSRLWQQEVAAQHPAPGTKHPSTKNKQHFRPSLVGRASADPDAARPCAAASGLVPSTAGGWIRPKRRAASQPASCLGRRKPTP